MADEKAETGMTPEDAPDPVLRMSAKATGRDGAKLTVEEIEAAEEEATAWARRVNTC